LGNLDSHDIQVSTVRSGQWFRSAHPHGVNAHAEHIILVEISIGNIG